MRRDRISHPEFEDWLWREAGKSWAYGHQGAVMDLFQAIGEAMEAQGVTQAELARRADLKPSYISRLFSAPENITMRTAFRLCNALDLTLGFDVRPKAVAVQAEKSASVPRRRRAPSPLKPRESAAVV